jgi:hypothetical protein
MRWKRTEAGGFVTFHVQLHMVMVKDLFEIELRAKLFEINPS